MSDGFLSRWARRKEAVRAAERNTTPEAPLAPDAKGLDAPAGLGPVSSSSPETGEAVSTDVPALGERHPIAEGGSGSDPETDLLADLPSLDALTPDTDLAPFLRSGVPTALRNAALRRMWSLDPGIRDFVSEAREYAYDWNTPGGVPGMGPLLPVDDVKAMLGRLFRDPAETGTAPAERIDDPSSDSDPVTADATPAVEAIPEAEPAAIATSPAAQTIAPATAQPEVVSAPPIEPRMRRHGGAMPS